MYADTVLPITNRLKRSTASRSRIHFIKNTTGKSLNFLKLSELLFCFFGLFLSILSTVYVKLSTLATIFLILPYLVCILIITTELVYYCHKRTLPIFLQLITTITNFAICTATATHIYLVKHSHEFLSVLLFVSGFNSIIFIVDFICKIIISTYLRQAIKERSTADAAVSAFIRKKPNPTFHKPKSPRTDTNIFPSSYGGTFPVNKYEPPFPGDSYNCLSDTPKKGESSKFIRIHLTSKCRNTQTPLKIVNEINSDNDDSDRFISEPTMTRKGIQTETKPEIHEISANPPFYLNQRKRKKSPWTCASSNASRKSGDASKFSNSSSTPITYSGTFSFNKDLVPIAASPKLSLHDVEVTEKYVKNPNIPSVVRPKSLQSSPRVYSQFVESQSIHRISEEQLSQCYSAEICSARRSKSDMLNLPILPGTVL